MILQALYEYCQRNKDKLPPKNFQMQEIKFVIKIRRDGEFLDLTDTREGRRGKPFLLPKAKNRSGSNSWQTVNLLWDHYGYLLAHPKDDTEKASDMAKKQQKSFLDNIKGLPRNVLVDEGVRAVLLFYEKGNWEKVKRHVLWPECAKIPGCNLSFQLDGDVGLVAGSDIVKQYQSTISTADNEFDEDVEKGAPSEKSFEGRCLITGKMAQIIRLHTPTPILGSRSNAKIVSFQKNYGFDSYHKEQAYNAPISIEAESAYSTALKHLIKSEANKLLIADSTIVFWAQKKAESGYDFESDFAWYLKNDKDNPDRGVKAVQGLYNAMQSGRLPLDEENRFYVLGLAPNAARISVRFWKTGTVKEFAEKIKQHFDDFQIVHGPKDPEHLSLYQVLSATALGYKMDNVPPNLAGAVIGSVLDGSPYPITLLHQCVRRIRAEQNVNRARAAILKAYINRFNRVHNKQEREVLMSLDRSNKNVGYRLGRLFAVLEKIQEEANPGINATIRDRFYGAVSATPLTVFPQLLKLKNHHLAKLNPGRKVNFEKEIGEIFDEVIDDIPAHMALNEQARFAVGYYHQRQDFFKKKDSNV